ncbi:hypothetical protein POTOM_059483 [Populus tomentosa]|uniref:Ionotropic glutamate receptor C-terminal domain-containing protein n=1 Tax=Populus tomentosa TaxID=118781 RepID=A0A8X7XSY1_POPTO|nr:hypothetical protein POTOM_059483 [Populus tomentosa]
MFSSCVAGKTLIRKDNVEAIIGLGTSQEAILVAELGNRYEVPILSMANEVPVWASLRWPFLINAARNQLSQMKAIAAIVQSWQWRRCRVFIVHTSATLARSTFREAKKLEMMEEEYVWITTDSTSDYFDTFNNPVLSSMQGALGVKSYISSSSKRIKDIRSRYQVMFSSQFPEEPFPEPRISALQAYDATWAVALAMEGRPSSQRFGNSTSITPIASMGGTRISTELGYWTEGYGFSKTVGAKHPLQQVNNSLKADHMAWRALVSSSRMGISSRGERLKIVVPSGNNHKEFINVSYDGPGVSIRVTGSVIDVFNATLSRLPYALPCDFTGYDGSYDAMVYQVYNQSFDAAIGDTAILANRSKYAEFSQPFTDPGLQMVVCQESKKINKVRLFFKPFTGKLWISIAAITVFFFSGEGLHSNLSRMVMVAWLFVAFITTQSFTANLSSLITLQQLNESPVTIDTLKKSSAKVGCDADSFVVAYLRNVLYIQDENIVRIRNEEDYTAALINGRIAAAFLEIPYIKAFLAKNCNGFTTSGPIYNVGGFGFVFPKNSPYIPDVSQAVVNISETLIDLLQISLNNSECSASNSDDHASIGLTPFSGPFLVTIGTSSIALFPFYLPSICQIWREHWPFNM